MKVSSVSRYSTGHIYCTCFIGCYWSSTRQTSGNGSSCLVSCTWLKRSTGWATVWATRVNRSTDLFSSTLVRDVMVPDFFSGKSWVTTGVVLPSRVVSLVIKRPPHFAFKPGDYIFINIPHIATFEWHPFTISSAPEQTDTISLHIRVVGHWTSKLYEYFEAEQKRLECAMHGGKCEVCQSSCLNRGLRDWEADRQLKKRACQCKFESRFESRLNCTWNLWWCFNDGEGSFWNLINHRDREKSREVLLPSGRN